jgi:hypothetical protein
MAVVPDRARQAFRILHVGFVVAPILAGLDKFFEVLVDWDRYLAPVVTDVLPVSGQSVMLAVGVIEIAAGVLVALRPRIGGYVVAVWLWASSSTCWWPATTSTSPCVTSASPSAPSPWQSWPRRSLAAASSP